jgi:hypothetical protein
MSFANLKASASTNFEKITKALDKLDSGGGNNYSDDRYWQPTVDSAGNGYAVIRFLPQKDGEDYPFVRMFTHGFKGPGGQWYIENSRSTLSIEDPDPVMQYNNKLWNSSEDDKGPERTQARNQKRKLNYISNIMVIQDSENPENEGKVFLYKYGKKIFDKIKDVMYPEFEDEKPLDPFNFWEGADFKLKIRKVEGYRNYDKSEFGEKSALQDGDDAKLEKTYESLYSLAELVAPDQFKPYADLKQKLDRVMGFDTAAFGSPQEVQAVRQSIPAAESTPAREKAPAPAPAAQQASGSSDDDDDDGLDFFKTLTED